MARPRNPIPDFNEWNRKQAEAFESTRNYLYTLFGGAKGGGKTIGGIRIRQVDISNYRNGIHVVMRKNYTVLHNTTKKSFEKFMDPRLIVRKKNESWYCVNGNQIWWWAADNSKDREYERTRGIECTSIMQDEASEGTEMLYELLPSLLRAPAISIDDGSEFIGNIYMTSNPVPGQNYLKRHFIDPRTRKRDGNHNFIQSLPDNNPLLPEGYIERAFATMNPTLLRMLRHGDWDVDASEFQIVSIGDLTEIAWELVEKTNVIAAGIDIGLGRPDASTLYLSDANGYTWRELTIEEYDTMQQYQIFAPYCAEIARNDGEVWIDASSVGKGLADRLTEAFGDRVIRSVGFGDGPIREDHEERIPYANLRAQMYFWARKDTSAAAGTARQGERPNLTVALNEQLIEEFENTFFMPKDGKLIIEPKDNIKERIGRSPDDADGFVLCNAARRTIADRPPSISMDRTQRKTRASLITQGY